MSRLIPTPLPESVRDDPLRDAEEAVYEAFASHAPTDLHLVIKNHPLDNGWINYRRQVERQAKLLQVSGRVHFIDGGGLTELIHGARGVVTANSTVGLNAIDYGKPLICLGEAIYDIPGLTFQGPLDEFWMTPMEVDKELAQAFIAVLIKICLVNGNFYTSEGMSYAIEGCLTRLLAE
jgi:capsular polysaccharide export protein